MLAFFKKRNALSQNGASQGDRAACRPDRDVVYVILDTELTGLDRRKDAILSIGAVKMSGARIEMGHTFYQLVNPPRAIAKKSIVIHEITPSDVEEKPPIEPVLADFLDFCGDAVLVGHFLNIDLGFLNREVKRLYGGALTNPCLDTLSLVDWLRWNSADQGPDAFTPKNFELTEIARGLGIQVQGAHNALMDAFMTAQVFQRLLPRLDRLGVNTLGDLLRVGSPNRKIHRPGTMV